MDFSENIYPLEGGKFCVQYCVREILYSTDVYIHIESLIISYPADQQ